MELFKGEFKNCHSCNQWQIEIDVLSTNHHVPAWASVELSILKCMLDKSADQFIRGQLLGFYTTFFCKIYYKTGLNIQKN